MKFKKPENQNYCATIVRIKNTFPLPKCDFIQSTTIFGNPIIISKDTKIGDVGVYFPAETQLSHEFTSKNNLYRHSELNEDKEKKGYLENNRRIRTMKMKGNKSCGLWLPIDCLSFMCIGLDEYQIGDVFDEVSGTPICNKYVTQKRNSQGLNKKKNKLLKLSKLIKNQFRFHEDTAQFGKNAHRFSEDDIVSISSKLHGTSVVISKILCKKKLNFFYKILKKIGVKIIDTEYSNIYSSRKVVKNDDLRKNQNHFYKENIWQLANEKLKEYLLDGMTVYAEIVGFLPNGSTIQSGLGKAFDYGCEPGTFEVYIYRITYTNTAGDVFEFSAKQVQDWCKSRGLKAVPELYYGEAGDIFQWWDPRSEYYDEDLSFGDNLINVLREKYLEQDCKMCKNKLPAEGIVIRKETTDFEAYKFKSFRFLEMETKQLDKGEEDIEEQN